MSAQIYDEDQMEPEHRVVVLDDIESIHAGDPLDGVPFDCWWIGLAKLLFQHGGADVPYPHLVGLSGEAFQIHYECGEPERAWRVWTYEGRGDYDFLNRACRAVGYAYELRRPADFDTALAEVCALLDENRPSIIGCRHGPALFIGYHVPEGIYRWVHPLALSETVDDLGWTIPEVLRDHWSHAWVPFAEPSPFMYLRFQQVGDPRPSESAIHEALRAALTQAEDVTSSAFPHLRRGDAAWAAWIEDLEAGRAREAFLYDTSLRRLRTARLCAALLCRRAAEAIPDGAEALRRASEACDRLAERLRDLGDLAADVDANAADCLIALREARELDRGAVADIRHALAGGA